jgi:hypothetical protein
VQLIERINFETGPGTTVPWKVTFTTVAGALYVATETALRPIRYERLIYPKASVAFEHVRAVDRLSRPAPPFAPQVPLVMREPPSSR